MDPISLSLLAISALSTGLGLFKGAKANDTAAQEGAAAVAKQTTQNQVDRKNEYATYLETIKATETQKTLAADALATEEAKKAKILKLALVGFGVALFALTMLLIFLKPKNQYRHG